MQGIPTKARMLEEPASSSISKQIATIIILEKCSVRQNKIYSQAHWAFPGMILTFLQTSKLEESESALRMKTRRLKRTSSVGDLVTITRQVQI